MNIAFILELVSTTKLKPVERIKTESNMTAIFLTDLGINQVSSQNKYDSQFTKKLLGC